MCAAVDFKKRLLADIHLAKKRFECYERIYTGISGEGKQYLQFQSRAYRKEAYNIQKIIRPALRENCPNCEGCCKLYSPNLSIYIAGTVGCFEFIDYILVRCDTSLPDPYFRNMEENLCPYWAYGCTLPDDCRSYACLQYFCDKLKKELDMYKISKHLKILKSIMDDFSIQKCLDFNSYLFRKAYNKCGNRLPM
jgi:hypothetical protein